MGWFGNSKGGGAVGAGLGYAVGGPMGAAAGSAAGSGNYNKNFSPFGLGGAGHGGSLGKWDVIGNALDKQNPYQYDQEATKAKIAGLRQNQSDDTRGVLDRMSANDQSYYSSMTGVSGHLQDDMDRLEKEAEGQASDARKTYTGTIQPEQKNMMERARSEAGGAMTLQEAGDPNNAVQQKVRALYDQQAQGVTRQGQADAGVLSALGAQAFAGQVGGGVPMTGGQMAAIAGQNMSQAGQAFAAAQRRAQDLKEQGIDRGFSESDRQYQRGQQAQDRYRQSVQDIQNSEGQYNDLQGRLRGERGGYAKDRAANRGGLAALKYGQGQAQAARDMGWINDKYNPQISDLGGEVAANNAARTGVMGSVGGILGGMMGGAAGAKGGAAAGGAVGGSGGGSGTSNGYGQGYTQGQGVQQSMYGYNDDGGAYGGAAGRGYNYGGYGQGYPARPQ